MLKGVKGGNEEYRKTGDMSAQALCHKCEIKDIYTYLENRNNEKYKFFLHNISEENKYGHIDKFIEDNCFYYIIRLNIIDNIIPPKFFHKDKINITNINESGCKNICNGIFNNKNYPVNYVNYVDEKNFMTHINNGTVIKLGKYDKAKENFDNGYNIKDILKYKFYFTIDAPDNKKENKEVDNNTTIQKKQKPEIIVDVPRINKNNENINEIKEPTQEPPQESTQEPPQKPPQESINESINESNNKSGLFNSFYIDFDKLTNKKKDTYNEIHTRINERPKFNKIHPKFNKIHPNFQAGKHKKHKTHKNKKPKNTKRKHTKKYKN